jgi:hypothetical protein
MNEAMDFDPVLATQLWEDTKDETDSAEKGKLLEDTVGYLFESLANFDVRFRLKGLAGEVDLVLRSRDPDEVLPREIGTYVLVECKNRSEAMTTAEVHNFAGKVRFAGCRSGVLVSRKGVTGTRGTTLRNAEYVIRTTYHRDGTILLLIDDDDMEAVIARRVGFVELLHQRYEQIRFDLDVA